MKKNINMKKSILIIFAFTLIVISCLGDKNAIRNTPNSLCDTLEILSLKHWIGKPLKDIVSTAQFVVKDTLMEGDDDVTWKAKAVYCNNNLIYLAESNWQNKDKIYRITIVDKSVKEGNIFIGQEFKYFAKAISTTIPNSPDGYLFLKLEKDTSVYLQLDISSIKDSVLFYGISNVNQIPQNLKVESIFIQ